MLYSPVLVLRLSEENNTMPRAEADPRLTRRQAENVRKKIAHQAGRYVQILGEHLEGKRQLQPTQVKAAQVLLSKVLPDEQRIEQVDSDTPVMSPSEVEQALADVIQTMMRNAPEKVRAMMERAEMDISTLVN